MRMMNIQDLFGVVASASYKTLTKKVIYRMIREILKSRKSINLKNDVAALYCNADTVAELIVDDFPDAEYLLEDIFMLPQVDKYLTRAGVKNNDFLNTSSEEDSSKNSDTTTDTDTSTDSSSESDTITDSDTDAASSSVSDGSSCVYIVESSYIGLYILSALNLVVSGFTLLKVSHII